MVQSLLPKPDVDAKGQLKETLGAPRKGKLMFSLWSEVKSFPFPLGPQISWNYRVRENQSPCTCQYSELSKRRAKLTRASGFRTVLNCDPNKKCVLQGNPVPIYSRNAKLRKHFPKSYWDQNCIFVLDWIHTRSLAVAFLRADYYPTL